MKNWILHWLGLGSASLRLSDLDDQLVFMRRHIVKLELEIRELRTKQRQDAGHWTGWS